MENTTTWAISAEHLQTYLADLCPGAHITVRDDTALHANHNKEVGHYGGHYKVRIVWGGFQGLTRVQRQRRVMELVAPLWHKKHIHAVSVKLLTPEEATTQRDE